MLAYCIMHSSKVVSHSDRRQMYAIAVEKSTVGVAPDYEPVPQESHTRLSLAAHASVQR
jgi:hypothetical protein